MERNLLFSLLLSALLLYAPCCFASEATYQITETELTQLENNLAQLKANRQKLLAQLQTLEEQQAKLEAQLAKSEALSKAQETQLQTVNESLKLYEQEVQSKQNSLRRDRTIAWSVAGCLLVGFLAK